MQYNPKTIRALTSSGMQKMLSRKYQIYGQLQTFYLKTIIGNVVAATFIYV